MPPKRRVVRKKHLDAFGFARRDSDDFVQANEVHDEANRGNEDLSWPAALARKTMALARPPDAILDIIANAARQGEAFGVSSEPNEMFRIMVMFSAGDLLLDHRYGVQLGGGVVTGRADQLRPALECSLMGICSDKRRQERMVNVDDGAAFSSHSQPGNTA